jgi:hypothetical protein
MVEGERMTGGDAEVEGGWQEPTRGSERGYNGERDLDELSSERRHAREAGTGTGEEERGWRSGKHNADYD